MKSKKLVDGLMALAVLFLSLSPVVPVGAAAVLAENSPQTPAAVNAVNSPYAATPPVLDGSLGFGEWNMPGQIPFHDGFISVTNDNTRLYVLLDVTNATTLDANDYFYLTFDKNRNSVIDPNVDVNYGTVRTNIRYQFYLGANTWTGVNPTTYSARAQGFGCFWPDGSYQLVSFFPLRLSCSQHRVWELAIDLSEINAFAGGTARMGVRIAGQKPAYSDDVPSGFTANFSSLTTINLAPPPFVSVAPLQGAVPAFETNPIEITQAIQTRDNHEPLVANKATVARVYTITGNVPSGETVNTYLYGTVAGVDLPGSPMLVQQRAPTVINRLTLNDTANFMLPPAWISGSVSFQARALDSNLNAASTTSQTINYTNTRTLNIWIVPVNTGSVASPVVPSQAEIERQKSYLRTIYPVASVNFVQKPWTVLGVVTGDPIPNLNNYYNSVALGYILTCIFTGTCPSYPLPDQVYGMTPSGGGISDPIWLGGEGIVARGFQGTSLEGTMAHEINHNLDKDPSGTWGHHTPFGCGATGPDPTWPYANSNINEVGFDTRLPWSTSSTQKTVIPSTVPDIMGYCQSGILPTKWISPYRWENLLNHATLTTLAALTKIDLASAATPVYYLSGKLSLSGRIISGKLDPIWQLPSPSSPNASDPNGNFAIRFLNNGQTVSEFMFKAAFISDPEEPSNTIYFNFKLPLIVGSPVSSVELVNLSNGATLDTINAGSAPLTVDISAPAAAASWSGAQSLQWGTSNDAALDTFNVLFSSDGGINWDTLASGLNGVNGLAIDTRTLPNTSTALLKVVASDGYNTGEATSGQFTINNPNPKPSVQITAPLTNFSTTPTNSVLLEGSGNDPTDGPLADDHLYWYEGTTLMGNGGHLVVALPAGLHKLTLKGINTGGQSASASISILVGLDKQVFLPKISR